MKTENENTAPMLTSDEMLKAFSKLPEKRQAQIGFFIVGYFQETSPVVDAMSHRNVRRVLVEQIASQFDETANHQMK